MNTVVTNPIEFDRQCRRAFAMVEAEVRQAATRATTKMAVLLQETSDDKAPVVTGQLKRSSRAIAAATVAEAEVGYEAPYAAHVHENMEGRRPKFLEKAVLQVGPRFVELVVKELR
jgi:hypothetical protein